MSKGKSNSRALRRLAEQVVRKFADDGDIFESQRGDFVTSLVRQWTTFDGNATLLLRDKQIYLGLGKPGELQIVTDASLPKWMEGLQNDWKIAPEDMPEAIERLNLGQSAEVVNTEGIPLLLCVDPKERKKEVKKLVKKPVSPGRKRDYRKIAGGELAKHIRMLVDEEKLTELADSVVRQWQQFQGHASIFLEEDRQIALKLTEQSDGGCNVVTVTKPCRLSPFLSSRGFSPEVIPDVIAHINLGQKIEFRDEFGLSLWN